VVTGYVESVSLDDIACTTRIGTRVPGGTTPVDVVLGGSGIDAGVVTLFIGEPQPVIDAPASMTAIETATTG
jgi:hypothetical protein